MLQFWAFTCNSKYMITSSAAESFRKGLEKFIGFTDDEWELIEEHLNLIHLKKKKHFVEAGKICNDVGFVVSGSVRYYYIKDGEDITNYFSFENELVSSYKSFLRREPGFSWIQALEDSLIVTISYANMQRMLAHPRLSYKMERMLRHIAEYYICCFEERMASFITQTPEERYLNLVVTGRDILQRMPQHYIANFLGITPVSLSRIRRRILKAV
jgi:CRP-like cAMP-binding protein